MADSLSRNEADPRSVASIVDQMISDAIAWGPVDAAKSAQFALAAVDAVKQLEGMLLKRAEASITSERKATYKRGERVLVAYESGHLEECTVEETVVWVKDATGHAHECTLGQLSPIVADRQGNARG